MKPSSLRLMVVALLGFSTVLSAAEVDSVSVTSSLSYAYGSEADASIQGVLELEPAAEFALRPRAALVASARIRLDAYDELEPDETPDADYAAASKPAILGSAGSAELRDFYLELRADNGLMRLGKQQIVWGRLDGIKVLDLLNPQDFREFILDDFGDSRIGLWSAYFDYSFGDWRAELALLPDGTGHAIPNSGAWFELTAPRFRFGAGPGQVSPPVVTASPGHSLNETAAGLRLSRQLGSADLSAVAYTGIDPEPLGRITSVAGQPVIERFHERRDAFGVSLDMGLGAAVARIEYAYQPQRTFNTRSTAGLQTVKLDQHRGAIGLDVDAPGGVFVNLQYLVDIVPDAPRELVRPGRDRIGTVFLRKRFAYDRLAMTARWYHSFTDDDDLASVGIEYAFTENTTFACTAELFSGTDTGLFGQFAGQDRLLLSLQHVF